MSEFNVSSMTDEELESLSNPDFTAPGATKDNEEEKPNQDKPITTPVSTEKPEVGVMTPEDYLDEEGNPIIEKIEEEEDTPIKSNSNSINYTNYYKLLVDKGEWQEVTDANGNPIDSSEIDAETFSELAIQQAQWKADSVLMEREQEFGSQYHELVNYMKNGGKVEDLAKFQAQTTDIESLDHTDPKEAEEIIKAHYEALNFSDKRIKTIIDSLKDQGDDILIENAAESKEKLLEAIQEEKEEEYRRQELVNARQKEAQQRFTKSLKEQIHSDQLADREKKEMEKFYFEYKHPIGGNQVASDFYVKYQEIQSDPSKFYKLVKFIKDIDSFDDRKKVEVNTQRKAYDLVRSGEALIKKDTQSPNEVKSTRKAPTTFKKLFS
jgi:Fe-S-cluster formation regulator IscX/YfhJ